MTLTDPLNATKPEVSRRGFVTLGAGAAFVIGNAASAKAQTEGFGNVHPPIVAENVTSPHAGKIYDEAGHAFFDDQRDSYVPSAAADAWSRTLAWFHQYLA